MSMSITGDDWSATRGREHIRRLSNEELSRVIARCEDAIADGSAEIGDFETFVLCQRELARRTWS